MIEETQNILIDDYFGQARFPSIVIFCLSKESTYTFIFCAYQNDFDIVVL